MNASDSEGTLRCPTCNAAQPWSDECRRCKSDLRLLRRVAAEAERARRNALRQLGLGHSPAALREARRAYELYPQPQTASLLAVCFLVCGQWAAATELSRRVPLED